MYISILILIFSCLFSINYIGGQSRVYDSNKYKSPIIKVDPATVRSNILPVPKDGTIIGFPILSISDTATRAIRPQTLKQYEKWLLTYKDKPAELVRFHRNNLNVLIRGGHLLETDMKVTSTFRNNKLWDTLSRGPQPEFLGYLPSNYRSSDGVPNKSMRHLTYINGDEIMKTWELQVGSKKPKVQIVV